MFFKPEYILILGFTIIIDYCAGILLEKETNVKKKKLFLIFSLIANIGVLAIFKYYNFINTNISDVANFFGFNNNIPYLNIVLPIGLSFHTFQAMSYTIEVYRGNQKAERHFGIYSLYVMFYPQLVAGPIERPQNLLHQFYEEHTFDYNNFTIGCRQIMWGLFKKVFIADRLALFVDPIYNNISIHSGIAIVIATVFFSFQIFCDFSGYSNIAIGTARIMGFKLMTNFNKPYHAKSVNEFWKRWHISLSAWFKDYLYISLGGNRVSNLRRYFNLFFVFLVSGLWHGASFTFIIWGALHGCYVTLELILKKGRNKIAKIIGLTKIKWLNNLLNHTLCFILVTYAWLFFRANNLNDSIYISRKIFNVFTELLKTIHNSKYANIILNEINLNKVIKGLLLIVLLEVIHVLEKNDGIENLIGKQTKIIRWALFFVTFFVIYLFGVFDNRQFIYFQF